MPHERRADMARHAGTRGQTIEPGPFAHINHHWDSLSACYGRVVSSCVSYIVRITVLGQALEALYYIMDNLYNIYIRKTLKADVGNSWQQISDSWGLAGEA